VIEVLRAAAEGITVFWYDSGNVIVFISVSEERFSSMFRTEEKVEPGEMWYGYWEDDCLNRSLEPNMRMTTLVGDLRNWSAWTKALRELGEITA
jgi:hypothetical protein